MRLRFSLGVFTPTSLGAATTDLRLDQGDLPDACQENVALAIDGDLLFEDSYLALPNMPASQLDGLLGADRAFANISMQS